MRRRALLVSLLAALTAALALTLLHTIHHPRHGRVWGSFVVYYGWDAVEQLKGFSLVILSPTVNPGVVRELKAAGATVVAYISVATLGGWEPWANMTPGNITVGWNPVWRERIVDPCTATWRRVFTWALGYVAGKGFNGVFLDNLDVADDYPWMAGCIAELVCSVKSLHPDMVVIVNRGFRLLGRIAGCIDGLVYEDIVLTYDPSTGRYRKPSPQQLAEARLLARMAYEQARRHGFQLLALAYADTTNETMVLEVARMTCSVLPDKHIPVYIAEPTLTTIGVGVDCSTLRGS